MYKAVIYSIDRARGGITQKILERSGIKALLINQIYEIKDVVLKYNSAVLIIDTKDAIKNEINLINEVVIDVGINRILYISNPFAPEVILSKVKEMLRNEENNYNNTQGELEENLKLFLKL